MVIELSFSTPANAYSAPVLGSSITVKLKRPEVLRIFFLSIPFVSNCSLFLVSVFLESVSVFHFSKTREILSLANLDEIKPIAGNLVLSMQIYID